MGEISSSGYKEYVAGLLAGVAAVATGHPFDTVKVQFLSTFIDPFGCNQRLRLILVFLFGVFAVPPLFLAVENSVCYFGMYYVSLKI